MDESWRDLREPHERLRWARLHRTEFVRPTDAARSLNIRPGTYRTYELAKADGGRWPDLSEVQRIAKKFGVSWTWLSTAQGSPYDEPAGEWRTMADHLASRMAGVPAEKKDDAIRAVEGVIDAFTRRAG